MSLPQAENERPRRRAIWLRPVCLVFFLALLPLPWTHQTGCNSSRDLTGAQILFEKQHDGMFVFAVIALALAVLSFALAPFVVTGIRFVLDLLTVIALGFFTLVLALGVMIINNVFPAGVAAVLAMFVATCEACYRAAEDLREIVEGWTQRKDRRSKG